MRRLAHLVHRPQRRRGPLGDTVATLSQPRHQGTGLHEQLAHLGEQARQHLPLVLCALGKQVRFFDRPADRLDLGEGGGGSPHPTRFELRQGAATALGDTP